MPKVVDHELRRSQIIADFLNLALTEGLENVSLRGIASHANISLRQVQYYFGTKDQLVQAGLSRLEEISNEAYLKNVAKLGESCTFEQTVNLIFDAALPTNDESRKFHQLWMSYSLMSLTSNPQLDAELLESPNKLEKLIFMLLKQAQIDGTLTNDLIIENETIVILGLINGLGTAVLFGQQSESKAKRAFYSHIKRLCTSN